MYVDGIMWEFWIVPPGGVVRQEGGGEEGMAIFTVCSYTFTLFWLRKTSMIVEMYQLSVKLPFAYLCLSSGDLFILLLFLYLFFYFSYYFTVHLFYYTYLWNIELKTKRSYIIYCTLVIGRVFCGPGLIAVFHTCTMSL